jgi:DNA-binding beta-propeller fold protein YncE
MSDVFNVQPALTPYKPVLPGSLCSARRRSTRTSSPECKDSSVLRTPVVTALHNGAWWANATKQFNFKRPDGLDAAAFNRVLWNGIKGANKLHPLRPNARRDEDDADTPAAGGAARAHK